MRNLIIKLALSIFLFFVSLPAQAAQVVQSSSIIDVAQHLEFQITYNPNDKHIYLWGRWLEPFWATNWHYCFLYFLTPNPMQNVAEFPISKVLSVTGVSSVVNPKGGWYVSNGINFDQVGMDWCMG